MPPIISIIYFSEYFLIVHFIYDIVTLVIYLDLIKFLMLIWYYLMKRAIYLSLGVNHTNDYISIN